eukprot:364152-Chlamydomonas_euryale.AAC.6
MHAHMSVPAQAPLHGLCQSWSCAERCSQGGFILQGQTLSSPIWCGTSWTDNQGCAAKSLTMAIAGPHLKVAGRCVHDGRTGCPGRLSAGRPKLSSASTVLGELQKRQP